MPEERPVELSVEILKEIRDGVRATNQRIDATNQRLDLTRTEVGGRIDQLRDELSRRIVESEVRTSTAIAELAGTVREMTGVLRASADLRPRVEQCEQAIRELRALGSRTE